MNKSYFIIFFWVYILLSCAGNEYQKSKISDSTVISFGSCSRENIDNQRWGEVLSQSPSIWIWLGDNIYGDTHDMAIMKKKYDIQKSRPGYQKMLQSGIEIVGTWDDHDYGVNDGGKDFDMKKESKKLMADFLDINTGNPVFTHEGVYQAYEYNFEKYKVKIILLDTRYFRDTIYWDSSSLAYLPNNEGDVLGEEQWRWLENEIKTSTAAVNIIGSSIQVIPEEHGYEKWANFPMARTRLFDLLKKYPDKKSFFISGDRHIAEISKMEIEGLPYAVYDFTSSGLTHTWRTVGNEPNKYRISNFIINLNFGIIKIDQLLSGKLQYSFQVIGEENKLLDEVKFTL